MYGSASNVTPESSGDESFGSKQVELVDERVRISGSSSPASAAVSEQLTERKESSSPRDLDNYVDVGLVRENSPSYTPSESQQHQDHPPPPLPIFSVSFHRKSVIFFCYIGVVLVYFLFSK